MSIDVTSISKHSHDGDINPFIMAHHRNPDKYTAYRRMWNNNAMNKLLFVMLETTSKCNLSCPMCIHSGVYPQVPDMSDELFGIAIKNLREMEIPSVCMNKTNEPLLDKKIYERIRTVAELESVVDIHMNTNAVLLDKHAGERLINSGLTRLLIGFDGRYRRSYETLRRGAEYQRTLGNILSFIELKNKLKAVFPVVRLSIVRTSVNEDEIEDWVSFWKDKADYLMIQEYVSEFGDGSRHHLFPKKYTKKRKYDFLHFNCQQPFERVAIRGDGTVLPCCFHQSTKMPLGNIMKTKLTDIWRGENAQALRDIFNKNTWRSHPICSECISSLETKRESST